jgi:hypothetical protein
VNGMAGDRGTPLAKKLGITEGSRLALIGAPDGVVSGVPESVTVTDTARGVADVVVAFFTERRLLERRVATLGRMVYPSGGLWIAWPKRASGVPTTVNEDVIREVVLPLGMVDNKVCAVDGTWSGLRMVWRRERRA